MGLAPLGHIQLTILVLGICLRKVLAHCSCFNLNPGNWSCFVKEMNGKKDSNDIKAIMLCAALGVKVVVAFCTPRIWF